jgi:hypothetical protein
MENKNAYKSWRIFKWIGDNVKKLIFIYLQKYLDYVFSVQNL